MKISAYENISRTQWESLIDEWIFNEKHRLMVKRKLLDGITFEQLSEEFDISVRHAQTIIYKSQNKIFKHLK